MRVLLTGANGFIGSHVGDEIVKLGWEIIATHRSNSDLTNTCNFAPTTKWINIEKIDWKEKVIEFNPQIIIHCAWIGVNEEERNNIAIQLQNLLFVGDLLHISKVCKVSKFIGLGSQAEYGTISEIVNESYPVAPNSAYGITKDATHQIIKNYCTIINTKWFWLRLFSFFGERQPKTWLIPSIAKKAQIGESIDTTFGEQQYAYLYVKDLAVAICKLAKSNIDSDLFVISARKTIKLKDLIAKIRDLGNPNCKINYGSIPYRPNQSMIIKGDSSKFERIFGDLEVTDFDQRLRIIVDQVLTN